MRNLRTGDAVIAAGTAGVFKYYYYASDSDLLAAAVYIPGSGERYFCAYDIKPIEELEDYEVECVI